MPQRILVAIDGSNHGAKAVDLAADIAKALGGELYLVHAVTDRPLNENERQLAETEYLGELPAAPRLDPALAGAGDPDLVARKIFTQLRVNEAAAREVIARHVLEDARARAEKAGAKVVETVVEGGAPAEVIVDTAKRLGVDHIFMGARGLGNLAGILLGSVSQKVVHDATCPCTIIK